MKQFALLVIKQQYTTSFNTENHVFTHSTVFCDPAIYFSKFHEIFGLCNGEACVLCEVGINFETLIRLISTFKGLKTLNDNVITKATDYGIVL